MKVGTDGVLLGAWADTQRAGHILDVGTGTGLIALMLAQRSGAIIDGIEIDKAAAIQAADNVKNNPWPDRINIIHSSIQKFADNCKTKYDLIVSNPPYFNNSLHSPDRKRTLARHTSSLSMDSLIQGVLKLLTPGGRFCVILPCDNSDIFIKNASACGLFPYRKLIIYPVPNKPPVRVISEFSFMPGELTEEYLAIEKRERHDYSEEYKKLTNAFYLAF